MALWRSMDRMSGNYKYVWKKNLRFGQETYAHNTKHWMSLINVRFNIHKLEIRDEVNWKRHTENNKFIWENDHCVSWYLVHGQNNSGSNSYNWFLFHLELLNLMTVIDFNRLILCGVSLERKLIVPYSFAVYPVWSIVYKAN
jgi:hypothetical protein